MRGFEKRQLELQARKAREAEEWHSARIQFRKGLESRGVQFHPLFVQVDAASPRSDAEWCTWWMRDEVAANTVDVQAAVARDYITLVMLHSGRMAEPGEIQTAWTWLQANNAGDEVLDAALMLTTLRATEKRPDICGSYAVHEYRNKLYGWSWNALEAASIDPYTRSTVWFLPGLLETDRHAKDANDLVDILAENLADFLLKWTPVRVSVTGPWHNDKGANLHRLVYSTSDTP